jgi:PilZ domain
MEADQGHDRLYTRYSFSAAAEIIDPSGAQMPSRVSNISFGGCRLAANGRLRLGAEVTIKIHLAADDFEAPAFVIHSTAIEMGVMFHNIGPAFFNVLHRWISAARSASEITPANTSNPVTRSGPASVNKQ